jgi:hypothetical protein
MSSAYREDRRIDPIRALNPVTKNEASALTDVNRERAIEVAWDKVADDFRKQNRPPRPFVQLMTSKKK